MKYLIIALLTSSVMAGLCAQINIPAMSPKAELTQRIGLTEITIDYSRPSIRERTLWGSEGLIPYNELWRTGANVATKISFSTDVTINNQVIKKGDYAILTTPGAITWEINLYHYESSNWNTYASAEPKLILTAPVHNNQESMESLMLYFDNITMATGDLIIWWGHVQLRLNVATSAHDNIMANIKRELDGPSSFDYFQAALYMHETQTDLPRALDYIQRVTAGDKARFFEVYREALILADLGYLDKAVASARRSKKLSEIAGNKDFVRLNTELIKKLSK